MMARNETPHPAAHDAPHDAPHDPARRASPGLGTDAEARPGTPRAAVNPLTVIGTILVVLGVWSILRTVGVVPDAVAEAIGGGWAVALVLVGGWLVWRGRRVVGTVLIVIGALNLVTRLVPGELIAPLLLILGGIGLLIGALGGWRWFVDRPRDALYDGVRRSFLPDRSARSIVAMFDGTTGAIDPVTDDQQVVECFALFGDVKIAVPHDVAVELRQTAVFGDVRAPDATSVTPVASVQVRATAVFGDVRLRRV